MLHWLRRLISHVCKLDKSPFADANTFFVWEPCSHSHAEVVPGFVRYLLDLGFDVSVIVSPKRYREGLFSRFKHPRIHFNRMARARIVRYFSKHGLGNAKGVLVTTAGKLAQPADYAAEVALFGKLSASQKVLLVEHDVKKAADNASIPENIIVLREPHYRNARATVVNPHVFGDFSPTPKNKELTRFITVGAMRAKRRNTQMLVDSVLALHALGYKNFKITVVGKGTPSSIPSLLRSFFEIKGRLDFSEMYEALDQADFFLPLLDPDNPAHDRYISTGTSGSFQLIYGFCKPCIIAEKFAEINGFNSTNAILYKQNGDLAEAMRHAIEMTPAQYGALQQSLGEYVAALYRTSLQNLKKLLDAQ